MTKAIKSNSKRIRDPLVGTNRRTAQGREIRDLYGSRMAAIEDGTHREPGVTLQAAVRRAVELHIICERFRARLVAAKQHNKSSLGELVRLENMVDRAERRVAELTPKPMSWWEQRQLEREQDSEDGETEA